MTQVSYLATVEGTKRSRERELSRWSGAWMLFSKLNGNVGAEPAAEGTKSPQRYLIWGRSSG